MRFFKLALFFVLILPVISFAATDSAESTWKPWSGYWWPNIYGGIGTGIDYKGQPAPMQKYDMISSANYNGPATEEFLRNYYNPDALSWEGLCGAFAAAAVTESSSFLPGVTDNVVFRTGDKKALVTIAHDLDWLEGVRQNCETPDIFHYWLLNYIKQEGKAFFAELDPSPEVWNYPVYKYSMTTEEVVGGLKVKCTIWYADDLVKPDYMGTNELTAYYEYTLYKTGSTITGGEWTGVSVYNHPQQLYLPLSRSTTMTKLDYDIVRRIVDKDDDALESQVPVSLSPGDYKLVLIDQDVYLSSLESGEEARLCIEKNEGTKSISLEITASDSSVIHQGVLSASVCINLSSDKSPYQIKVSQSEYDDPGIYTLKYDVRKNYEYVNPKVIKSGGWGGVAIVNPLNEPVSDIFLAGYGRSGQPVQSYFGPFSLAPNEKKTIMLSDLKIRNVDKQEFQGIKVLSPSSLSLAYMSAMSSYGMASLIYSSPSTTLVLPDTATWSSYLRSLSWGLYNPENTETTASLKLFKRDGSISNSGDLKLDPKAMANYVEGASGPFSRSTDGGWMLINSDKPIAGYEEWSERSGIAFDSLPLLKPSNEFVIPHAITDSKWKTGLVVINTGDSVVQANIRLVKSGTVDETIITLNPYEKKKFYVTDIFPQQSADTISGSAVTVSASANIAGYFSYETSKDMMLFSMLDQSRMKSRLVMPHAALTEDWWTGLMVYNPSADPVEVVIQPYGNGGIELPNRSTVRIDGLSKSVFLLSDLFPNDLYSIEHIVLSASSGQGIYGLYGIGDHNSSTLGGGILE